MDPYIFGQQFVNGIVLGCAYGLIAIGYSMVYGIIGMINFAHGEVYMISAYISAISLALLTWLGVDALALKLSLVLIMTIFLAALAGFAIERLAYKPLRKAGRLAPLISAIGVSLALQAYVQLGQGARNQGVPTLVAGQFRIGSESDFLQITHVQMAIVFVSLLVMTATWFLIQKTRLGRASRATQQDPWMARNLGVNTDRVISFVFVLGAALAAVAGVLITMNYGAFDFSIGFITGLKAFTAAVLGGIGSLPGAMLGGIVLGLCESMFSGFVNSDYKDVFAFSVLILVLIFKPSGLLGRPAIEKV
jgi:branched-chain amino acid transport system permease protein